MARKEGPAPMICYDFQKVSPERGDLGVMDDGMTRQEFADECDINTIMKRYEATGVISHVNHAEPVYLDTTMFHGLQHSLDVFKEAEAAFNALPATVRREFDNDPVAFVNFASERENLPRLRELGLAPPEKAPDPPIKVEVVPTPAAPASPQAGSPPGSST